MPTLPLSSSQIKLVYLAGIIDGEGHLTVVPIKNGRGIAYSTARMIVTQKDRRLTDWLKQNFGGSISSVIDRRTDAEYHRWELRGRGARDLTKLIEPYLIVKREQAQPLLETLPVLVRHISRQQVA